MTAFEIEKRLFANSGVPKETKYKIAWGCLESPNNNIRANGKTWLTHRAIEGEITYGDWASKILPVSSPNLTNRWFASLTIAIAYYMILNGEDATELLGDIHDLVDIKEAPEAIPNFLRASCLLAQATSNDESACRAVIETTLVKWKSAVARLNLLAAPSWPADQGHDLAPIHCLLRIAERIGMTTFRQDQSAWIDGYANASASKTWMTCLRRLERGMPMPNRLTFACVMKSGGIYTHEHVERLFRLVRANYSGDFRFVCLSDQESPKATIPLMRELPGWWSKLELFDHDFGKTCYLDLDIDITCSIDWIDGLCVRDDFFAREDPGWPGTINSSIMIWRGPRPNITKDFCIDAQPKMLRSGQVNSDQVWIESRTKNITTLLPPLVASYKAHGASGGSIVVYHGEPKPWEVGL